MGFLKSAAKAWDASTDWAAERGQGRVMASTKAPSSRHCANCGRKATKKTHGIGHCTRRECLRALGDLF